MNQLQLHLDQVSSGTFNGIQYLTLQTTLLKQLMSLVYIENIVA